MRPGLCIAFAAALAASSLPGSAAEAAGTLRFNWNHCEGDGLVADQSFACDTNTGIERLFATLTLDDGIPRAAVVGFEYFVDFRLTTSGLPDWWKVTAGLCRSNALAAGHDSWSSFPSPNCTPWYDESVAGPVLSVSSIELGDDGPNGVGVRGVVTLQPGVTVELPPGQELLFLRIAFNHSKSAGTGSCSGCDSPACAGFGLLSLSFADGSHEAFVGSPASARTWQGAFVTGYAPVPGHPEGPAYVTYHGNLQCALTPVPARGRTWGTIKTLYR